MSRSRQALASLMVLATTTWPIDAAAATGPVAGRGGKAAGPSSEVLRGGGTHFRVVLPGGPVHVFRPAGYDRRTAGIVVYVHGYYLHVDGAWSEHRLAEQFNRSRRNALFVVPEAPAAPEEVSPFTDLRSLLRQTLRQTGLTRPRGPLSVAGHSAAYRTIVPWLAERSLRNVILIDALYGNEAEFRSWVESDPGNRLTLVVKGTAKHADPFVQALPYAQSVPAIPSSLARLSRAERSARVLSLRSQYGHFELITEGKVLPALLSSRTALPSVGPAARAPGGP